MIYSNLVQTNGRAALDARQILTMLRAVRQWGAVAALALLLAVGTAVVAGSPAAHAQEANAAAAVTKVNINTADATTLAAALKGIGESRALEIVRHREAYGPFASADELTEVKGIGKSTLDMNRNVITLE